MEQKKNRKNIVQFLILGVIVALAFIALIAVIILQSGQNGTQNGTFAEETGSEEESQEQTPEEKYEAAKDLIAAYALTETDGYVLDETKSDYLYFGQYPQSRVDEEAVIAFLDTVSFDENGYAAVDDAVFAAVETDGERSYYAVEPICWYILEDNEDTYFLFAEKVLDCKQYHATYEAVNFNTADITEWLNSDFYRTAFTEAQRASIVLTEFAQAYNPIYGNLTGETEEFYVVLMQMDDLMDETYIYAKEDNQSRRAYATDYAVALGVYVDEEQYGRYWTCAQGYDAMNVVCADSSGILSSSGYFVYQTNIGVRPVITVVK